MIDNKKDTKLGPEKPYVKYLLHNIPQDLWRRTKHRAIDDGDSLRGLILKALEAYLT